jgi:epoxyqueuosine reductase
MSTEQSLTEFVKVEAARLGFDLVGITTPEPPPHLDIYERWIARHQHGSMAYLETERAVGRRSDPRAILPECKSILVVGVNYLPQQRGGSGIARYALGVDYHQLLVNRLRQLVHQLEELVGEPVPNRLYADTGPILERELAQRAGLGWIGKNTCLIHPEHGSYFLLAEALLGIELVADQPVLSDHCGSCTLCIEACPTQCIQPDRTIDARSCISYLTIELKGPIPAELRPQLGEWLFGCDVCQEVCPWNLRFSAPTDDPSFQPRPLLQRVEPATMLRLTPESYRDQLRDSPLKRAKRDGLLRNAAVAAANRGEAEAVPALLELLGDADAPLGRSHAIWALARLQAVEALKQALGFVDDPALADEIHGALEELEG